MDEILEMGDILEKWHVPSPRMDIYNYTVYICPECDNNMLDTGFDHAVGFAPLQTGEVAMVIECDKCGTRFHFHAGVNGYRTFVAAQRRLEHQAQQGK